MKTPTDIIIAKVFATLVFLLLYIWMFDEYRETHGTKGAIIIILSGSLVGLFILFLAGAL